MVVRWYFYHCLSAANVRNLLTERGIDVSWQTVADWAQKFSVLLAEAGRCYAKPLSRRWFADEAYVRVGKAWAYLYRAVDEAGQVVDVRLREKRDLESAKAFIVQAIERRGVVPDGLPLISTARTFEPYSSIRRTSSTIGRDYTVSGRLLPSRSNARMFLSRTSCGQCVLALSFVRTGQNLLAGIELAQAVQRRHVCLLY